MAVNELIRFIENSPSAFHAAEALSGMLDRGGL